ncbi:MAG: MBG domain-containing protein [Roseburia intestinalis]
MKKKNTMPEKDWQQTHEKIRWRELRKRILVMGLTVAMVANTVDLSALSVSAKTDESETGKTTIVSFEELSKDITEQTLPIGALESDIKFPTSLTVTVEKTTHADEKEADDEEDASETGDTEKDDAQKDDSNGDTASSDDKKDTESSDEKDGDSGNADASETGDTEKDDVQKDDSNGDTASSDDKKDTESSDEKDGDSGNADASDKSGASDNGNADTKDSDTSKDSENSDKSNNPNGSSSSDTEDTQARADLPSAFGALIGQMADTLLPHKLIVHAAEKDDASDTASTSDVADNAKKTDTASTSDNADSVKTTGSSDAAASSETETTTEKIRLKNIKWELNVEESDAEEFDSSEASNGFCYAYTPVLPNEDGDGNQLVLGKDVELPTIYVLVGEYGIALLADGTIEVTEMKADGTVQQKYNAQDLATWIGGHGSANLEKVSIKLLNDDTSITEELTIGTGLAKEIELDLNGHTLTLQGGNARLYFKRVNITITSSGSNKGTITGNYDYGNKFKGDGLVTADYDSILKIERVTIKNAGKGSTVALWNGVTCTIDAASISGSSGDQVGTITIDNGKACTITNTEVTGNVASGYGAIMFMDSCSDCTIGDGAVIKNENSGGYCVKVNGNYNVKITVEKDATLTANTGSGTIMNTSYGKVAVVIEGGTFNGRLILPDNSQITGGTFVPASGCAIEANGSNKTLQDLLKVGYTLQYEDGTYANLTAKYTDKKKKVTAVKSPLYFTTHPTIASGAETVMENYTAAEAPELTVEAVSGSAGSDSISYQWYADETINGTTKNKVEQTGQGATSATYKIPTGLLAGTYQYYCVATCGEYTATSQKAAFTVEEGVAEVTVGGNTTRYATLTKAFDAVKATVNAADADADLEITLKILKNISETGSEWKIDGGTKNVNFCMDLNGCTVTGKGLYIIGEGVKAVFKDAGTGQNGTLNAPVSIRNKAKLTVENGNYTKNLRFSSGATGELKGGYYSQSIYIGNANSDNTGISCTITGGEYKGSEVCVYGGAALSVSGADTKIDTLQIDHSKKLRAEVTLSGGEYKIITLVAFPGSNDDLLDEEQRYAIADTLAEGYAFYSAGIKTDISRTEKTLNNVKVLPADTPEDVSLAVVKFQIEKNDGKTKTKYFLTWDAAMSCLEATESNLNNLQEYTTWKKLEILLLKDAEATRGYALANKAYLPAEITLRSEGNEPHTLTGRVNQLFKTGEQDVTIENINVVGNISFPGDTAVLRLGGGVAGLKNVMVPSGKAEIVIEKGAEIPATFSGDDQSNLDVSIYCNHDSAGDIASRIEQGASAFKVWFPIELGGITLPTDGENVTNITQRDGATYGLYSNGGTTDQKIKVTGEVCSYEPYGGNAVTIKTTDLSFTMPSSKVTLKAHTKDDHGYCSNCKRTDLAEAYKKSRLIIEGLEGRIYDGYPQVMTGITLKTANGDVKLTGPKYKSGKELAQDSTGSANADITNADYTVVYENNIKCNENKESTDAPTAIITGRGAYYGTVAFKFAIGQGEMQAAGATATAAEYDGKAHTALADSDAINVTLKADKYDENAHIPVTGGYIAPCTGKTLAKDGFDSEYVDKFPLKISCKLADGKGYDNANEYTVTNAGSYPFTIMVMAENNSCPSVEIPLTAKITPRDLSKLSIPPTPLSGCAYYTGKPYSFDDLDWEAADLKKILTDSGVTGADGGSYVLVKDTDFTVTEEDTTGPTTDAKPAKLNLTGKGNYTGNAAIRFEIPYSFTLAQTPVSGTDKWYRADVPVSFAIDDQNDAAQILYRNSKAAASDSWLNGSVEIYEGLEAAVAGENPGYAFTQEGKNTVTLYGKDTAKGCLSEPVEVTICIDKSAPTWADKDGVADGYGIQIKENWFRSLLNTISFGYLYNDATLDIKIQANDKKADVAEVSGISRYYYYVEKVSDTALASVKTKDELDALAAGGKFSEVAAGTGTILPSSDGATISGSLSSEGNYVVYAYAVDGAGNQSDYICTDGIVVDAQAPVVKIADPKKEDGTLKDTEAVLKVNLSEDATLMWFFVSEGVFDGVTDYTYDDCKRDIENYMKGEPKYPQFAVENDGKWAPRNGWNFKPDENLYCGQWEVRTEGLKYSNANQNFVASWTPSIFKTTGTKGDNKIEIGNFGKPDVYFPLYPSKKTAVWIAAIDKAGNITALTKPAIEFTTAKTTPYVKTAPVLSGTYGNTVSAMFEKADMTKAVVTAGLNSDTKVEGTWTLAAEDADKLPTVGTSEKYSLVFTPTGSDADTYDSVTCEVTPEVSKKQITVVIADKEKFYGEKKPALTWSLASSDVYPDNVLVADDTEEALGISLSTTAKDNSGVGTYAITGTSDSTNYEVSFTGSGSDGESGILTVKQAANSFTTELSCSDYTYAKDETPEPNATAKFGTVTYKYATAALDGTAYKAPSDESAYTDAIPVNAGIYAVKAYVAETDNYAGLTSDPVVFTINKAASPNIGDEEKSYSYVAGSHDKAISVDIAGKLPTDRGTTTYALTNTYNEQLLSDVAVDQDGKLTYKVKEADESQVGATATITVTASMLNYEDAVYTMTIKITDKKLVTLKSGNTVSVNGSNALTYGDKLSKLGFSDVTFVEADTDTEVKGTLKWADPDCIPTAGTTQAGWVFKPDDSKYYEDLTGTAAITVARATPAVVTVPTVAERVYNPAVALADSDMTGGSVTGADGNSLAGTWNFTGKNIIPTVNNKGYQAVFTPDDADNYNTVTRTITVKVTKATPVIAQKPTAGALTYGQKLSDSTLTGGKAAYQTADGTEITGTFAWKNSSSTPTAADSKKTEYDVTFTPSDKDNYNAVDTKLTITVNKAAQAPNMPQAEMAPAHSTKKVGDITLPDGWNWQEADKDTALADGVAVTANAIYTGTDKGNYETESVSITITRSECDHTHTEIRNQREATCKEEGYTGDTYCKDCGEKLAAGTTIEKKPHKVGTPATCVSKAVCSVCSETFGEVDATNHVHTTVKNRKEATCTQTGYAGDTYCTDCDKLLSTGKELAALGHDYKATVTKQPTTTEEGIRTYTCTRCNSSYTESIAKLPEEKHTHNYTGSITKEATCTEAGVRTYTCSCGDSYTENIPATGHSYVSKVTKAATTTEEGIMTYTCSKCGHSYTQPIAMIKSDNSNKDNGSQNQKPQSGTDNGNQNQKPQPDTDNGKDNGTSIKPYIKDDSGKEGWDVIKPQLEEAKAGDTVTVVMNGTTVVPKDVIDSIKGKDTTLVLDMGNGLSWKIYGKDITNAAGDIDFDVTVGTDAGKSIPVDVINNVTGEHSSLNLTLAYDGEFGFTATLTVNMESKNAGLYANLFYYNEQTGELEFISAGQIDPDGNVELVFTHASDYTIVVDAKIMSDNAQADNKSDETIPAPKTDDSTSKYAWNNTIIIIIGICIILIVFGAVFYVRKKSGSEEE